MMRLKNLLFIISLIIFFMGVSFLICIPYAIYYHEPLDPFYISALILIISGLLFYVASNRKIGNIGSNRELVVLVTLSWFVLILAGTMPYVISRTIPSLFDVFFETVSGMTTTGSSILTNVENLPKSILFWRSLTHWIGGLATIIILFTIMPSLNIGGHELFPIKKKTVSRMRLMIVQVFVIYCVLTFTQVFLLISGGMSLFESLCHSFGTVSTGCFSPKNNGISGYSPYLQYVMAFFMFLSGFSYVIYFLVISGKYKKVIKIEEIKVYFIVIISAFLLITSILYFNVGKRFDIALRESVFQIASFVSSSGYSTTNYLMWPSHILPVLYLLIFIGGCTGSASGGIKMARFLILFKNLKLQFNIPALTANTMAIKYNRNNIDENANLSVLTFITVFGVLFVAGTICLSFFEPDLKKSVFLAISALSTFGHNISLSNFPNAGKFILGFLMIAGRLEIYPLLLLFLPFFYKTPKNKLENISEQ